MAVTLGACVTHAAIEDEQVADPSRGLMPRVAATLAYRAIRTRGTIGGSLALSDPAAEWPAVLTALDAEVTVRGPGGRDRSKCGEFTTGIFETRLAADEIIESVRIPKLSADARWGYLKLWRKAGEFASALRSSSPTTRAAIRVSSLAQPTAPRWCWTKPRGSFARRPRRCHRMRWRPIWTVRAGRHFDELQRNLHAVAAMRAVRQVMHDRDPLADQRRRYRG